MKIPHPIPYQGSKRNLADKILRFFPKKINRLIEPFAGSAAITIAASYYYKANSFLINDINEPLTKLWKRIINEPEDLIKTYYDIWNNQIGDEENYYYQIREKFNETQNPDYLLFLLAKCVKAAVRYNAQGKFNQSPDKRRLGRNPQVMRDDILGVSQLLKNRIEITSFDYQNIIKRANENDLIYMDPPYEGTGNSGGFKYLGDIDYENFIISLYELNKNKVPYILSYSGRTEGRIFGKPMPDKLNLTKIEINAGRSSQATLLNRVENTFETLYLSTALVEKIEYKEIKEKNVVNHQLMLF